MYFNILLHKKIMLESKHLNNNLHENIEGELKACVGDKCISEGFVKSDSIKIIKRSIGYKGDKSFNGSITYDIIYSADVCNPPAGTILDTTIQRINKIGLEAVEGPLSIIVGKQYHRNKEAFNGLSVGDKIKIIIIGKRFTVGNRIIDIVGKLYNEAEMSYKIKVKKNNADSSTTSKTADIGDDLDEEEPIEKEAKEETTEEIDLLEAPDDELTGENDELDESTQDEIQDTDEETE